MESDSAASLNYDAILQAELGSWELAQLEQSEVLSPRQHLISVCGLFCGLSLRCRRSSMPEEHARAAACQASMEPFLSD